MPTGVSSLWLQLVSQRRPVCPVCGACMETWEFPQRSWLRATPQNRYKYGDSRGVNLRTSSLLGREFKTKWQTGSLGGEGRQASCNSQPVFITPLTTAPPNSSEYGTQSLPQSLALVAFPLFLLSYAFCPLRLGYCSSVLFALYLFMEYQLQTGQNSPGKLPFIPQILNVLFDPPSAARSPRPHR